MIVDCRFPLIHFRPLQVPNQLVGAPLATDVTIICNVEASPKAINYWQRENGKIMNRKNIQFITFIGGFLWRLLPTEI